jgi:enterochelin esterase-like enzyme
MRYLLLFAFVCLLTPTSWAQASIFDTLRLADGYQLFQCTFGATADLQGRKVSIWVPRQTGITPKKMKVLYVNDGQNLFDSQSAFGGQSWQLHRSCDSLIEANAIEPVLLVGIWNSSDRFKEYLPSPAFENLPLPLQQALTTERAGNPLSDAYLHWLVNTLQPWVVANFEVESGREHTFIMGSSMGGLISAYALAKYPQVFGGAACLSTHWPLSLQQNDTAFSAPYRRWLTEKLALLPADTRLYMDYGTNTLDAWYEVHQLAFDSSLVALRLPWSYSSRRFEGAAHNETAWRERVHLPLLFLLTR